MVMGLADHLWTDHWKHLIPGCTKDYFFPDDALLYNIAASTAIEAKVRRGMCVFGEQKAGAIRRDASVAFAGFD